MTSNLKLIAGCIRDSKTDFNFDTNSVDRGWAFRASWACRCTWRELSLSGESSPNLNVAVGALLGDGSQSRRQILMTARRRHDRVWPTAQ